MQTHCWIHNVSVSATFVPSSLSKLVNQNNSELTGMQPVFCSQHTPHLNSSLRISTQCTINLDVCVACVSHTAHSPSLTLGVLSTDSHPDRRGD